jgi:hypothetical protein
MITKEVLIADVILSLNQGVVSDDSELEPEHVAHWINVHINDLIRKEIISEQSKGNMIPPIYIVRETALEMNEEDVDGVEDDKQRIWVDIEGEVLDLPRDMGVVRVLDQDGNLIRKTSIDNLEDTRHLRFAKPSLNNVLHYREGKKIFIEGFNTADLDFNELIVDYIPKQNVLELDDEDEILVSDQLLPLLIASVVQTGKLMLYGTQPDQDSDSSDRKDTAYHLAINNPTAPQSNAQPQP